MTNKTGRDFSLQPGANVSVLQQAGAKVADIVGRESAAIRSLRPFYENVLNWCSGGRGIPWPINGVTFRIAPQHRCRLGQNYDAPVAAFFRERIRPGAVCFDVGANVGVYVLQFAHWTGASGRVVAFEPNPEARKALERHIDLNGFSGRVKVVPAAVGAAAAEATLYAAGADGMSRLNAPNAAIANEVQPVSVPVITLDEYWQRTSVMPDVLLIDIEGFEIAALQGARKLIDAARDKLLIVVEMHPGVWDSAGAGRQDAERIIQELGLDPRPLNGQSDPLAEHGLVHLAYRNQGK